LKQRKAVEEYNTAFLYAWHAATIMNFLGPKHPIKVEDLIGKPPVRKEPQKPPEEWRQWAEQLGLKAGGNSGSR